MTKKIIASILGLTMALVMVPGMAQGLTAEELLAEIQRLQAEVDALMVQYQALTGTPAAGVPAACVGITFTANLSTGSTGNDVKCLQAFLNTDSATQVATTGAGSPGNETSYFGPLTYAAAVRFQNKYAAEILTPLGLTAGTGFVGPATRTKLNAMLTATPSPLPPPVACTVDADCLTGEVCQASVCVTPIVEPAEGTLTVTAGAIPPNTGTIYVGQTKAAVAGLNVKALGSDIKLTRLDINFGSRAWLNVADITIADGTTDVFTYEVTEANTIEAVAGTTWLVRLTGLSITIPDGVTKVLTVKVTPKLVVGTSAATITYNIPANGIRGTDGIGIQQYGPTTAISRTFSIGSATAALALSVNASNPVERAVIGSATAITENVELLRFDLKATINDVIVSRITTAAIVDTGDILQTLKLYDGDTLLAATSVVTGAAHVFAPLNVRVSKDTTKTLSIKADLEILTTARQNGSTTVSITADTTGIAAADAGIFSAVTPSGSTATGKRIYAYTAAPKLVLVSTSIVKNRDGRAEGSNTISADAKIKFSVTAQGGDIYVGSTTGTGIIATTTASVSGISITPMTNAYASDATIEAVAWLVRQGETKSFEVTSFFTNASPTATFVNMYLNSVLWGTSTVGVTAYTWDWTSLQTEFRTTDEYLQGTN